MDCVKIECLLSNLEGILKIQRKCTGKQKHIASVLGRNGQRLACGWNKRTIWRRFCTKRLSGSFIFVCSNNPWQIDVQSSISNRAFLITVVWELALLVASIQEEKKKKKNARKSSFVNQLIFSLNANIPLFMEKPWTRGTIWFLLHPPLVAHLHPLCSLSEKHDSSHLYYRITPWGSIKKKKGAFMPAWPGWHNECITHCQPLKTLVCTFICTFPSWPFNSHMFTFQGLLRWEYEGLSGLSDQPQIRSLFFSVSLKANVPENDSFHSVNQRHTAPSCF